MASEFIAQTFEVAGAVIVSVGGAGIVLIGLSSWLGKVWASRIMEREKTAWTVILEGEKAALQKLQEEHRSGLRELADQRQDALIRRRDVYTQLATRMRILLKANIDVAEQNRGKIAFMEAYDKGFIWATEACGGRYPRFDYCDGTENRR